MSEPKIDIILTMDASQANETVREFGQQSADALNRTFAGAAERAAAKINDLAETQKRLGAVISENTTRMDQLRQAADRSSTGEKQNIEQEIAALKTLNQNHQNEIALLAEKRVKLEAKGAAAAASSDAEKLAIQLVTQSRLIDMQALRDSVRAQQHVRDVATASAEAQKAALDELDRKQFNILQTIDQHKQKLQDIASTQRTVGSEVDIALNAEAAGVQKAIDLHKAEVSELDVKKAKVLEAAALSRSTSEAETDAVKATYDQQRQAFAVEQDQARIQQQVGKAVAAASATAIADAARRAAAMETVNRKEVEHRTLIDQESRQLDAMKAKRDAASGDEKKQLDQQAESLRKIIEVHRQEAYEIELKRVQLEEEDAVARSTSAAEIEAAKNLASDQRLNLQLNKDLTKSQGAVSQSVTETGSAIGAMGRQLMGALGIAGGIAGVVMAFRQLDRVIVEVREDTEKALSAMQKFRDLGADTFDKSKSMFNEFGITDEGKQRDLQKQLMSASAESHVKMSTIASTMADVAPVMMQYGIDPLSERGKGFMTTLGIAADRGISGESLRTLTQQTLQENPNATGADLGTGNLVANTGSPSMANAFLGAYGENKAKIEEVLSGESSAQKFGDAEKLFRHLTRNKSLPVGTAGEVMGRYFQTRAAMQGKDWQATIDLANKQAMSGTKGSAEIANFLSGVDPSKGIDQEQFLKLAETLDPHTQDVIFGDIGGRRAIVAMRAAQGFEGESLTTNAPSLAPQTSPEASAAADKERVDAQYALDNPTEAGGNELAESVKQEMDVISKRNDAFTWAWKKMTPGDQENYAYTNVQAKTFLKYARLLQSGKITDPKQLAAIRRQMQILGGALDDGDVKDALMNGNAGKFTREGVLQKADVDEEQWLREHADYAGTATPSPNVARNIAHSIDYENTLEQQKAPATTRPATQPVSINYNNNQRINVYGTAFDQIGSPNDYGGRYS